MENYKRIYGQLLLSDDQIEVYFFILIFLYYIQNILSKLNKIYLRYLKKLFQHLIKYLYI